MHLFCSQSYYDDRSVFVSRQAALQQQSSLHPKSLAVPTVASCGLPVRVVVLASASANRVIVVLGDKIHKYVGICGDNKIKYQIKPPANVLWWSTWFDCDPRRVQFNSYCRNVLEELNSATCLRPLRSRCWPNENQNRSKNVAIMPLDWFPLGRDRWTLIYFASIRLACNYFHFLCLG